MKRALTTALDKHDREREMTAVLLSALYNEVGGWVGGAAPCRAALCSGFLVHCNKGCLLG